MGSGFLGIQKRTFPATTAIALQERGRQLFRGCVGARRGWHSSVARVGDRIRRCGRGRVARPRHGERACLSGGGQLGDRRAVPAENAVLQKLGNGRFADVTDSAGPAFKELRPARGLATGDLDGDGRPEVVIVNMNQPPTVLKNNGPAAECDWVRVDRHTFKPKRNRGALHDCGRRAPAESLK